MIRLACLFLIAFWARGAAQTTKAVRITWDAPLAVQEQVSAFHVYRLESGGTTGTRRYVSSVPVTKTIETLYLKRGSYYFTVTASNRFGESLGAEPLLIKVGR